MSTIDKIFDLLILRGKQQKELTDFLGIDKGVSSQWKTGKSRSYLKYIDKIAEFLEVSTDELLSTGEGSSNPVYLDDETLEFIDTLRKRPEMKTFGCMISSQVHIRVLPLPKKSMQSKWLTTS